MIGRSGRALGALALLAASAGPACTGQDEREARLVLQRIDALRDATDAPPSRRRELLQELRTSRAGMTLAAEARDACVAAYSDLLDAADREEAARRAMASGAPADPLALVKALDDAEVLLDRSRENMPRCDRAATDLRAARP